MSKRVGAAVGAGAFTGVLLSGLVCVPGLVAQTPKNPISTKPEGTTPTCTYSGSITDGKPSDSSSCNPGTVPGTDPNLTLPRNATQQFPFPGESPAATTDAPATQNPATPAAPGSQTTAPANQRFPFPGETTPDDSTNSASGPPASPTGGPQPHSSAPPLQDAGSSGSSSSSSTSSSSSAEPGYSSSGAGPDMPDDDPNAPLPTPHRTSRKKLPPPEKVVTPDEKEAEDVQVAGFYQNDGNYKAAYERAKEAVGLVADDADAHLALAEAARKLGKLDEAESNYKKTLALDPVPKTRRIAEKALKEMSGS